MTRARLWLKSAFTGVQLSEIYSTHALNGQSADYLNMVARVRTSATLPELTALCKAFEEECGRTPESKQRGSIEMDVDIMKFGGDVLRPAEWSRPYFTLGLSQLTDKC